MLSINRSIIFAEEIDDQAEKKEFYISSGTCSLNLFMKFVYNNMKNYIPGMDCNRTLIPIDSVEKTWWKYHLKYRNFFCDCKSINFIHFWGNIDEYHGAGSTNMENNDFFAICKLETFHAKHRWFRDLYGSFPKSYFEMLYNEAF